ncbi:uncharacterized protein LOC141628859 [Silene latifolia]|uniref:uncharacterized protein LOC141628859 n=1 Tax=Silene latifolia TaxID=37657 RepID=UPI003D76B831
MFADDLLLFCKGDTASIMVLLRSFAIFSSASGLQMNSTKTDAYFNGTPKTLKDDILQISGFHEGHMPFKYLGVPITCGRMTKSECNVLVEKLIHRIQSFGSKKLSYTGRLLLIYLKGEDWKDYKPSENMSWGWKSICRVKQKLASGYQNGLWLLDSKGYTMCSGCDPVRNTFQTVQWHHYVWNMSCLHRHRFIGWLIAREALQLKEKLFALGIATNEDCLLCGREPETHAHLFWDCDYSRRIFSEIGKLCILSFPTSDHMQWRGLVRVHS